MSTNSIRSITHRVGGRNYHITGANADLWQIATERFENRQLDTLARAFGSSDDNERVEASKQLVCELWQVHPELGPYPFLDSLSKLEFERAFFSRYRDHVCHQLKVYLLGLGVLGCAPVLRDATVELVGER